LINCMLFEIEQTSLFSDNQSMQSKVSATREKEVVQTACHKDITESPWDPSYLFMVHDESDWEKVIEVW
jgi:hypothetical protein